MGIRQEVESRVINGYRASFHIDTGGPVGSDHFITVRPTEELESDWFITRWFYFDEENERYAWNFAEKVCTNESYRRASIEEDADWSRVANLYEIHSRKLYDVLSSSDVSDFPIMNDESRSDKDKLWDCCQALFDGFHEVVRDGKDKHPEKIFNEQKASLNEFLDEKYS